MLIGWIAPTSSIASEAPVAKVGSRKLGLGSTVTGKDGRGLSHTDAETSRIDVGQAIAFGCHAEVRRADSGGK